MAITITGAQLMTRVAIEGSAEAKAELDSYSRKVSDTTQSLQDKLGSGLKIAATLGAGALIGLGVSATKMAGDFNAGLTTLVTGAGESQKNLGLVHDKMLDISVATGTMTDQLVAGEYMINSAGQKGAQALDTLEKSAMGARVGAASLGDEANAVTTIMTDFSDEHITAAQAVNTLTATVSDGKTHLSDLAGSFAVVLPVAAAFHLRLQDITGAMATMTGEGTPAADAATYLKQTIASLESPGAKAVSILKSIGLTSKQISDEMKVSLPDTLQMIEDHLAKKFPPGSAAYTNALKDIAGGTKTFQGMLELTGTHLQTLEQNVADITQKVKQGGNSIVGWSQVQGDFNQKLDETHAAFDAMQIKLGEELLPIVEKFLTDDVMPAIQHFGEWESQTHGLENAFQTVVSVLGTVITDTEAVVGWFGKAGPQGEILKGVALTLGAAIATIKIGNVVKDIGNFISDVPTLLVKMGLVEVAAEGVSGAKDATKGLAGIGPAAKTAAQDTATAFGEGGAMRLSLLGSASIIAGMVFALGQVAQQIPDVQNAMNPTGGNVFNNNMVSGPNSMGQMTRNLFQPGGVFGGPSTQQQQQDMQNLKEQQDGIAQGWKDINALFDEFAGKRLLGMLDDPVGGITATDTKVMTFKEHLDDLNNAVYLEGPNGTTSLKPTFIGTLSKDAETADNKIRILKDDMDKVVTAMSIGLPKLNVDVVYNVSQRDDTSYNPTPGGTIVGNRGIVGHASGILNSPTGHWATVGERGPETMFIPRGSSVFPNGASPLSGAATPTQITLEIDGQRLAHLLMPYQAATQRSGLGLVGV